MKFARDILLIDIEATSQDIEKGFPLQLAAVLLDKDNLLEKNFFNSYIKHPFSQTTNDQIVQTLGVPKEKWITAPNLKTVMQNFKDTFPYNVTLASHNIININFLRESFKKAKIDYEYDYHIIDLWTLGYFLMSKQNLKKIPTAETLGTYFRIEKSADHDAMENARYLAEILRKIVRS